MIRRLQLVAAVGLAKVAIRLNDAAASLARAAMPDDHPFVDCCNEGDIMFCGDPRDPETGEPTFYTVSEVGITQALRETEER